jgi:acyl carrier protein
MTIILPSVATTKGFSTVGIRTLIAKHLDVDVERVTDDAQFINDLGADWLDRLELMILIEDQFHGLEITDDDADQIKVVGDLIRYVENWVKRGEPLVSEGPGQCGGHVGEAPD